MGKKYDDVELDQGKVLEEIEKNLGKELKRQKKILWDVSGYSSEEKNVVELNLNFRDLKALPESIGQLTSLTTLFLNKNQLASIPESIGNLTKLEHLALAENRLRTIPDSIGNLRTLKTLWLNSNLLKSIPDSIGKMMFLEDLNIERNQLAELPEAIGALKALKNLDISHNRLTTVPESFGKLKSLEFLDLEHNRIEILPESLGNLKSLEKLDLSHNQLKALPGSLGNLKSLQSLDLQRNQLKTLPGSLWKLENLQNLQIKANPLGHEWDTIKQKGLDAILEYCRKIGAINVFMSFAVADYETGKNPIAEVADKLKEKDEIGYVYHCMKDMKKDGNLDKFMDATIPMCQVLLFIATKKSLASKDCQHELALANTHHIKIIPILGKELTWDDAALKGAGLTRELGLSFQNYELPKLCNELYDYILEYRRKYDLFEKKDAELKVELLNIKHLLSNYLTSADFEKILKKNMPQFKALFQDLSTNKISPQKYFLAFVDLLTAKKTPAKQSSNRTNEKESDAS